MYPFYPQNNYYFVQPAEQSRRIPRTFLHNVDLDDYLQLQLLLQREQERRQLLIEEERQRRLRLEEEQRLEAALRRLRYCQQESQREHTLAAARAREEQQKRRRLIVQAIAEDEYRRRVAAAVEQKHQAELTKRYREELLRKQRAQEEAAKYEEARRRQLANLLKHVFGHQVELDNEEDVKNEKQKAAALQDNEWATWQDYLDSSDEEEQPNKANATSSSPLSSQQTAKQVHNHPEQPKSAPTELKDHVVTLQDLLQELLTGVPVNRGSTPTQRQPTPPATATTTATATSKPSATTTTHTPSPKLSPANAPARVTPPLTEAEAATKIQRWYKKAHETHEQAKISHQLRALDDLSSRLDAVQQQHEQQVLSRPLSFHDDGRLSSQSENREFLVYEDELMKIMLKLDTIESFGNEVVRDRRKALVKRAEGMLAAIDAYKQKEWERTSSADEEEERKEEEVVAPEDVSSVVEQEQIPVTATELVQEQQNAEVEQRVTKAVVEEAQTEVEDKAVEEVRPEAEEKVVVEEAHPEVEKNVVEEAQAEVEEKVVDAGITEPIVTKDTIQEEQPKDKQFTEAAEQVTTEQITPAVQEQQTELDVIEQPVTDTSVPSTLESALAEASEPHTKHHITVVEVPDLEDDDVMRPKDLHVEEEEEFVML